MTALVMVAAFAAPPPTLEEIVALARGGAPAIALHLLDAHQQDPNLAQAAWAAAERERIHILAAAAEWRALDARVAALPETLPAPFLDWAAERRAEALLQVGDGQGARAVLRTLVWTTPTDTDALRAWRLLIVRSYQSDGNRDAALAALRRYAQDYGADDPMLGRLHAEVLLAAGRPDAALEAIGEVDDPLRWVALLHADPANAGTAFERSVRLGSARDTAAGQRRGAWGVAARAARVMGNDAAVVAALERALQTDPGNDLVPAAVDSTAPELWEAYRAWGGALGNASRLIVGIDEGWLAAAGAIAAREPAQARALYARVATDTDDPATAAAAHARLGALIEAEPGGAVVLAALYLDGGLFAEPEAIPAAVRHRVVEPVLRNGDFAVGAQLLADLDAAPEGADALEWGLWRARVLVLGGRRAAGKAALDALLDAHNDYDADRLLQVLFELQAAGAHAEALPLFARIYAREGNELQLRREVLYWMADSWRALDDFSEAARFYLRSAQLADPYAMDQWAQTARFQAADALERAGLLSDAASLLQALLNATPDPARRAQLQHRIDALTRREAGAAR
ncbi:MAG: hypothetical protein LC632_07575 [Xanthomonadaceae bacterium]|nr:hypothetical protein [Xanthomonadaceae bacterium]